MRPLFRATAGTDDVRTQVTLAAELGLAGILHPFLLDRQRADIDAFAAALEETDLKASCVLATRVSEVMRPWWTASDGRDRRELAESIRVAASVAGLVGSSTLVTLIAANPDEDDDRPQREAVVANLRAMARIAGDHGLRLAFEPMVDLPGMLVRSVAEGVELLDEVDEPTAGLVFDTAHVATTDGDVVHAWEAAKGHIAHLQVADQPGRGEPGTGALPLADVLTRALHSGYEGLVDLELDWAKEGAEGEQQGMSAVRALDREVHRRISRLHDGT